MSDIGMSVVSNCCDGEVSIKDKSLLLGLGFEIKQYYFCHECKKECELKRRKETKLKK